LKALTGDPNFGIAGKSFFPYNPALFTQPRDLLGARLASSRFDVLAENISNPSHNVPADGQTKTDAQKSNHCCNAP
jgi:hypothetical protein